MDEFKTDKAIYTALDFGIWQQHKWLSITPKFQRRKVWSTPARSYFIDTMLRGMTVPPIYLRLTQNEARTAIIREVVDGQQRVSCVLDFIRDDGEGFRLSKTLKAPWAGKTFEDLEEDQQRQIKEFGFPAEVFKGISDKHLFEVFCRLNMNGVPLNAQELRNGRYFGRFKQASFDLALEYLEFWRHHGVFTERSIARMLEVELTSELLIAGIDGMQDKKASIEDFYDDLDDSYPSEHRDTKRFREVMDTISQAFNGDLDAGAFHRPPLFYTLYCVVYHYMYSMKDVPRPSPQRRLGAAQRDSLRDAVVSLSEIVARSKDPAARVPKKHAAFLVACARQTDNINPRRVRFDALFDAAF